MSVFVLWLACTDDRPIEVAAVLPVLREQLAARERAAEWVHAPLVAGIGPAYQIRAGTTRAYLGTDRLTATDLRAAAPSWSVALALTRWGSADDLRPVEAGVASAAGTRAEVRRPGIVEWVEGTPEGPEHGFTIDDPPAGDELVLELVASGGVPRQLADRVRIRGAAGGIDWAHLAVWDDERRTLPARSEVDGQIVRVRVNVAGARFPVTIDPLVLVAEAAQTLDTLPNQPLSSLLGASLALDQDRLLIGDPGDNSPEERGVVACLRPSLGWGAEWSVSPSSMTGAGRSVGLHGRTAVIAGDGSSVAVYAYERSALDWVQSATQPLGCDDCGGVQLDLGAELLVVGQPEDGGGLVEVWARDPLDPGELTKLQITGGTGAPEDALGSAVTTAGAYVVAGAPGSGRVRIWQRSDADAVWVGDLTTEDDSFGAAVDLDGHRLAVGAPGEGRVYLYTLVEGGATGQITLEAPVVSGSGFGTRVALAGTTLVALDHPGAGDVQAHLFELGAGGWRWRDSIVVGPDGPNAATLALSDDWLATAQPDARQYSVWSRTGDALKRVAPVTLPGEVGEGGAVAVSGNTVAVGNYQPDVAVCPGVAVFERGDDGEFGWLQTLTDCSPDALFPDEEDGLGDSVALVEREVLVAGNPRYGLGDTDYGRVVVWRHDGTAYVDPQYLFAPDAIGYLRFGASVATDGVRLVVGQPSFESWDESDAVSQSYLYTRDTDGAWVQTQGLGESVNLAQPYLGSRVGLGDGLVAVGGAPPTRELVDSHGDVEVYDEHGELRDHFVGAATASLLGDTLAMDRGRLVFTEPGGPDGPRLTVVDFDEIGDASAETEIDTADDVVAVHGERMVTRHVDDGTGAAVTRVWRHQAGGVWAPVAEHDAEARGAGGRWVVMETADGALDLYELAAANLPPTARDDSYTGTTGPNPVQFESVLRNDSDADLDPLSVELGTGPVPASARLTLDPDGTFQIAPSVDGAFPDQVMFTYRVTDGAFTAEATVIATLTAPPPDDTPEGQREIRLVSACSAAPADRSAALALALAWIGLRRTRARRQHFGGGRPARVGK